MARPILLSNCRLHVGLNEFGLVRDMHYPYIGAENHTVGEASRHRVGIYVDDTISWLDDRSWDIQLSYPHQSLIGHIRAYNAELGVCLEFDDAVDSERDVFMRSLHVINMSDRSRTIRLFMHQSFVIGDARTAADSCYYLPADHAIVHARGQRVFIISAESDHRVFDQYSIGLANIDGHEGTYRDAEDGELAMNASEYGRVDSTLRLPLEIEAHGSKRVSYWIAASTTYRQALDTHRSVRRRGVNAYIVATQRSLQRWLKPARKHLARLTDENRIEALTCLMRLKAHCDANGAIIANLDSDTDGNYCQIRDAAYAIWPLLRLGYTDEPEKFFDFCCRNFHPDGYLQHSYASNDGSGAESRPYHYENGLSVAPISEDETALVVMLIAEYCEAHPKTMCLMRCYSEMVLPMADFLTRYIDNKTDLPLPSYDMASSDWVTSTYTTATVYGALQSAANLAEKAGDATNAVRWRSTAQSMSEAASRRLLDAESVMLRTNMNDNDDDDSLRDEIAALYAAHMFGLFMSDSKELKNTAEKIERTLVSAAQPVNQGGINNHIPDITPIMKLWMAQYMKGCGKEVVGRTLLVGARSMVIQENGVIASIHPGVWMHAEYLSTLLDFASEKS